MSFSEDIKTIAETKELYDLVNKLSPAQTPFKDSINAKRTIAKQEADGTKADSAGANDSGDENTVTGPDGNNSLYEFGAAVQNPLNVLGAIQELYDKYLEMKILFGLAFGPSTYGTMQTDLSNSATQLNTTSNTPTGGGGGTRTQAANQADPANATGTQGANWVDIEAAMTDRGASAQEIANAQLAFFTTEAGKHEIGAVVEGDAGPKPSVGNWDTITSNIQPKPRPEILNAMVGVDTEDNAMAVEIRFDGRDTLPSIAEALAAGQNPWTSLDEGPIRAGHEYTAGLVWTLNIGATEYFGQTWADLKATVIAAHPGLLFYAVEDNGGAFSSWLVTSLDCPQGDYALFGGAGGDIGDTAGSVGGTGIPYHAYVPGVGVAGGKYGQEDCGLDIDSAAVCALPPPTDTRETAWPPVGLYVLKFLGGKLEFSGFDSEVPDRLREGSISTVDIKSAVTGRTIRIENAIEGGFLVYDTVDPEYMLYYASDRSLRATPPVAAYKFYKAR